MKRQKNFRMIVSISLLVVCVGLSAVAIEPDAEKVLSMYVAYGGPEVVVCHSSDLHGNCRLACGPARACWGRLIARSKRCPAIWGRPGRSRFSALSFR